jgi:hypothetical protein
MFVADLAGFPDRAVLSALTRCRREVRGVLTVSDVVSRIDDGRPGPEEAWAMLPRDEATTVAWTDEMRQAWSVARPLLEAGEDIPARMAFKESYVKALAAARDSHAPVRWEISLGHDVDGRTEVVNRAVELGRITADHAKNLLPAPKNNVLVEFLLTGDSKPLLESVAPEKRANVKEQIAKMKDMVGKGAFAT